MGDANYKCTFSVFDGGYDCGATGSVDGSTWRDVSKHEEDGSVYVDKLQVPNMPEGTYVLQWRWDCIETAQVWSSCADINLHLTPTPTPPPSPSPGPSACHAISATVSDEWCANNCAAGFCPADLCSCGSSFAV